MFELCWVDINPIFPGVFHQQLMSLVQTILRDQPARGLWNNPCKNKQKPKIWQIILWVVYDLYGKYGFAVLRAEDEMQYKEWEPLNGNSPNKGTLTRRYIGHCSRWGSKLFRAFIAFLRDILKLQGRTTSWENTKKKYIYETPAFCAYTHSCPTFNCHCIFANAV